MIRRLSVLKTEVLLGSLSVLLLVLAATNPTERDFVRWAAKPQVREIEEMGCYEGDRSFPFVIGCAGSIVRGREELTTFVEGELAQRVERKGFGVFSVYWMDGGTYLGIGKSHFLTLEF